jgi:hypothetical protein
MVRPIHIALSTSALLGFASARQVPGRVQDTAGRWVIADRPLLSIGADGTDTLIFRAGSAVRLSNGAIVVATGRASQLQVFDAAGGYVRSVGRRGQGPNEFGRSIYVYLGSADTVVAHDATNRRYHYITPDGRFVKLDTLGDSRREAWMYDRTIVARLPGGVDLTRVRAALGRIPFNPRDSVRFARVDALGNVWMHDSAQSPAMTIYSPEGQRIGSIAIPARFRPYQILDTLVLGHWTDSTDDTERIQVRRLSKQRAPARATPPAARSGYDQDAQLLEHRAILLTMQSSLRNFGTAQEAYFADYNRYASSVEELTRTGVVRLPPGVTYSLVAPTRNSYSVIATHPATRAVCVLVPGADLPTWVICG